MPDVDATCILRRDSVVAVTSPLAAAPAAWRLSGAAVALTLADGAAGPTLLVGPQAAARLGAGLPLLVMEIDAAGPARASVPDRHPGPGDLR